MNKRVNKIENNKEIDNKFENNCDNITIDKNEYVDLKLSLEPEKMSTMSEIHKEYIIDEISKLPPLKPGQINLNAVYAFDMGDKLEVHAYVRNANSIAINFGKVQLKIINTKHEIIAKQIFQLSSIGDIPPFSVRPFKVFFDKSNVYTNDIKNEKWKLVFDSNFAIKNTVKIELENIQPVHLEECKTFLKNLPNIDQGNISISLYKVNKRENDDLAISVLIRNATDKGLNISKLPINIKDIENNQALISGVFNIEKIVVNPYKAQIINLVFKKHELPENVDVNKLAIFFPKYEV
jgi:SLAP domain-containing protein